MTPSYAAVPPFPLGVFFRRFFFNMHRAASRRRLRRKAKAVLRYRISFDFLLHESLCRDSEQRISRSMSTRVWHKWWEVSVKSVSDGRAVLKYQAP